MKLSYCCLENMSQIICRERPKRLDVASYDLGYHGEGLNFLL